MFWCCQGDEHEESDFELGARPFVNETTRAPWTVWGDEAMADATGERCAYIVGDPLGQCEFKDHYSDVEDEAACTNCDHCVESAQDRRLKSKKEKEKEGGGDTCVTKSDGDARTFEQTWPLAFLVFLIGPLLAMIVILIAQCQAVSGSAWKILDASPPRGRVDAAGTRRRRRGSDARASAIAS